MGYVTHYDEKREVLRDALSDCLRMAKDLLDEDINGYEEMKDGYAINLYVAVKKARDTVYGDVNKTDF